MTQGVKSTSILGSLKAKKIYMKMFIQNISKKIKLIRRMKLGQEDIEKRKKKLIN